MGGKPVRALEELDQDHASDESAEMRPERHAALLRPDDAGHAAEDLHRTRTSALIPISASVT